MDKVMSKAFRKAPLTPPSPEMQFPASTGWGDSQVSANSEQKWYPEVLHFCPYTPLILVGLKSDLRHKKSCIDMLKTQGLTPVTSEQGMAVAKKMGAQYMECSSKEMRGVDEIFEQAIMTVVANDRRNLETPTASAVGGGDGKSSGPAVGGIKRKKRKCQFL